MDSVLVCGCGRIGSPLLTFLASKGFNAAGVDVDDSIIGPVTARFKEEGWQEILDELETPPVIYSYNDLKVQDKKYDVVIITCGTPVDNNQNPDTSQLTACADSLVRVGVIGPETLVILRSTIFPGGTRWLQRYVSDKFGLNWNMIFCPERIAEGYTFKELEGLPQIIAGDTFKAITMAEEFFNKFTKELQVLRPSEGGTRAGELAKLMCNVWRYIIFATANEFSMICDNNDADFNAVRRAVNYNYSRANIPLAALNLGGPCLGKDAKILSAFSEIDEITESAYKVAEKTCIHYIDKYRSEIPHMNVGVLGLAFKSGSDNNMNSLSYKAIKHLEILGAKNIKTYDPNIQHKKYHSELGDVMKCDLVVVMTEHPEFKDLKFVGQKVIRL